MTRLVLVHGSVGNAAMTFAQQRPLAERFELVLHTRSGYPPRAAVSAIDFEEQAAELADELRPGDHLVGHSYGAVVSMLAAATRGDLGSLTVGEPPAFGVARDNPAVRDFVATYQAFSTTDPKEYLDFFLPLVGSRLPPARELSPELEQGTRAAMAERPPNEAGIPLETLRARPYPKLVISGGHNAAFDAVCDVLEHELGAERAVVPGAGHSLPRAPGYNDVLVDFVERAAWIETERLLIRKLTPAGAEQLFALWVDPANERVDFSPERPPDEQVRRWIESAWGVWERETGELVGDCSLSFDGGFLEWELSYGFRRDRWGRGYASEAAEACLRYGFEVLGVEKIVADVDPANGASVRVLEKLGFLHTGEVGGKLFYERTR